MTSWNSIKKLSFEKCYFSLFSLYIFFSVYRCSCINEMHPVSNTTMFIVLGCMSCIYLLRTNCSPYMKVFFIILSMIGLLVYANGQSILILQYVVLSFTAYKKDYSRILKAILLSTLCAIALILILYYSGYLPHYGFYRLGTNGVVIRERSAFGFYHPNTFSAHLLGLCLALYLYQKKKIGVVFLVFLALVTLFIYYYPNSNTVVISLSLLIATILFSKIKSFFHKISFCVSKRIRIIVALILPILAIVPIKGMYNRTFNSLYEFFGKNAFARASLAYIALRTYKITLFGQPLKIFGSYYFLKNPSSLQSFFTIDNFYVYLFLSCGIIGTFIFWYTVVKGVANAISSKNSKYIICIIILLVFSWAETGIGLGVMSFVCMGAYCDMNSPLEENAGG